MFARGHNSRGSIVCEEVCLPDGLSDCNQGTISQRGGNWVRGAGKSDWSWGSHSHDHRLAQLAFSHILEPGRGRRGRAVEEFGNEGREVNEKGREGGG